MQIAFSHLHRGWGIKISRRKVSQEKNFAKFLNANFFSATLFSREISPSSAETRRPLLAFRSHPDGELRRGPAAEPGRSEVQHVLRPRREASAGRYALRAPPCR